MALQGAVSYFRESQSMNGYRVSFSRKLSLHQEYMERPILEYGSFRSLESQIFSVSKRLSVNFRDKL